MMKGFLRLLSLLFFHYWMSDGVYFTQLGREFSLRYDDIETFSIGLCPFYEKYELGTLNYSIQQKSSSNCPILEMDSIIQNQIILRRKQKVIDNEDIDLPRLCNYTLQATLPHSFNITQYNEIHISITWTHQFQCTTSEQCFSYLNDPINIKLMENNEERVRVALFGTKSCPRQETKYHVTGNEIDPFHGEIYIQPGVEENFPFEIWVKGQLDRETRDFIPFILHCQISNETLYRMGQLIVLDENDNPPMTQHGTQKANVSISLQNVHNQFKPHGRLIQEYPSPLLFRDLDTLQVNKYNLNLKNDIKGLLNVTYLQHSVVTGNRSEYTAIMPIINLSEKVDDIHPWYGSYCVEAVFDDIGYILNSSTSNMEYEICVHWINNTQEVTISEGYPMSITNTSASKLPACDRHCIFAIFIASGTILLLFLIGVGYTIRSRISRKDKRLHNLLTSSITTGEITGEELDYMRPNSLQLMTPNIRQHLLTTSLCSTPIVNIDPKWEIPRDALVLEDVLGVGEFGRVFKGRTRVLGGVEGTWVPVAVKMLKDSLGKSQSDEFLSEFSLLTQLDHSNVIKLYGACTSTEGPLYLVMEYAAFGSLRSFLRKCRHVECEDYSPDIEGSNTVSPREILQFCWQIAKGMTYLSEIKMVHRDLAARNILLTERKICKISDFGLSRDVYIDESYRKKSEDRVPVKWLAPESLSDEIYTTKSDVWSFGILLWELTALGASPYPGIKSEELYALLKSGYRMTQPENASDELYSLMNQCWLMDPRDRPTFRSLGLSIEKLLENGVEYLTLDTPLVSNPAYNYQ